MRSVRGFTLIELLVVIAILAVLSVTGFAVFTNVSKAARDAKRKADIDAIAKAYEVKASAGRYAAIGDTDFASGKKPSDPSSGKGEYFNYLASDKSGYKVCASLDNNPSSFCNSSATNCYCKFSSQSTISSASTADASSTNFGSGPGGSSSSCDPNGSLYAGLVGYWKMDEVPGSSTIADSSGNANSGTLNGANIITPSHTQSFPTDLPVVFANAGNFDGTDDFINVPDSNSLDTTEFTVSAWIKINSLYDWNGVIRKGTDGYENYAIYVGGSGQVHMPIVWNEDGTRSNEADAPSGTVPATGQWYHIAQTYKPGEWRFYRNGQKITDVIIVSKTPRVNASPLEIGMNQALRWFRGIMDDVRIYNRALSDTEISTLYNIGNGCVY